MTRRTDLSIVLPIRNDPASRALAGLSSQLKELCRGTPTAVELVVVDDASSDGTVGMAKEVLQGLERAKLVELESNGGPGKARNAGLDAAAGEYVVFVDADDDLDVVVVLEGVSLARESAADVVSLGYQEIGGNRKPYIVTPQSHASLSSMLSRRAAVWRFIYRREFLADSDIRFPELYYAEDVVFALRVAEANPRVASLPECAYTYHLHSSGLSGSRPTPERAEIALRELLHLERSSVSSEVALLALAWAARIALRSQRGLFDMNPRVLARLSTAMLANPKAAWLLTASRRQARRTV